MIFIPYRKRPNEPTSFKKSMNPYSIFQSFTYKAFTNLKKITENGGSEIQKKSIHFSISG
jgi:hypothetical protein